VRIVSNLLEALGLLGLVVAAYFVDWRLALALASLVAVVLGLVLDPPRRSE
jgi:hypothetical protein